MGSSGDPLADLRRRQDKIDADMETNLRGLKWSLIGLVCGLGLIALGSVLQLLVQIGVIH